MSLKYKVTVDGTAYTVEVEEVGAGSPVTGSPVVSAPAAPVAAVSAPKPAAAAAPVAAGASVVEAPMPGKVLDVKVSAGASVKSGDLVVILEAMKMENEIFASTSGTVKEVRAKSGDSVNTGDVLIVIG
jgi:glutaconyl-CoA decarboxylase